MRSPADEYRDRVAARRARLEQLNRTDARYAAARLGVFALAVLILILAFRGVLTYWWLLAPATAFAFLISRHDRLIRARDAAARAVDYYTWAQARLEDTWIGRGEPGERFRDDRHLCANDLDLFGHGSLFELLSVARTRAGEEMLASWLKAGAPPAVVRARQEAVRELAPALDLREDLAVAGIESTTDLHRESLVAWAETPPVLTPPALRWVSLGLAAAAVAALFAWWATGEPRPALLILFAEAVFAWSLRHRLRHAMAGAEIAAHELDVLGHLLDRLERETFSAGRLSALRQQLDTGGVAASRAIRALDRLIDMHDWEHNLLFVLITLPLLWRLQLAFAIEGWRRDHGSHVALWIGSVAEFETLSSLATYHYEHPDDPFPELVSSPDGARPLARFEGTGLAHPLLAAARMVRNDVTLGVQTRLLVVSGSNMSGKSTLLRTVGVNAVMALAGAPVRATSLRLSPLTIGATLRIQDSLQEGRSRFYAEITRIRELADAAQGDVPLLFLLDELFHGTNSHDRLIGASGVLRSLLDRGAIGLITTHDLALTAIADELSPRAANIHFEDLFDAGTIRFDYRAKPGPVTRSNALSLMRAVGLDVDDRQT